MRVAPYPYNLMNALCAASSVSFTDYAIATLLSLPKLFLETSIGAGVQTLTEGMMERLTWEKILQLVLTAVLGVSVTLYVVWLARRVIKKYQAELNQQQQGSRPPSQLEPEAEGKGAAGLAGSGELRIAVARASSPDTPGLVGEPSDEEAALMTHDGQEASVRG